MTATCFADSRVLTQGVLEFIESLRIAWNVPGLSVGVVRLDEGVEVHGLGVMNNDSDKVTPDTLFGLGSCTKAFVATAVGILISDIKEGPNGTLPPLNWDTKVQKILPDDWALCDKSASVQATLQDILSMQSGLPWHDHSYPADATTLDVTRHLRFLLPTAELRERWQYNNLMYMVTSEVLNKYTGDHKQFIQDRILNPVGMSSTTFSEVKAKRTGHFSSSWDNSSHGRQIPYWFPEPTANFMSAAGGLISSANDITKWLKLVLGSIAPHKKCVAPVVPSDVLQKITTARTIVQGLPEYPEVSIQGYGMGWFRESYRGHDRVHHYGSLPGVSSRVSVYPEARLAVVVLVNIDARENFNLIIDNTIADRVLGLTKIHWEERWKMVLPSPPKIDETEPLLHLSAYAGTYSNEGYGEIILTFPSASDNRASPVADFDKVDASYNVAYKWQLQALWPRIWSSHLRLVSIGDNKFYAQTSSIFPDGFANDSSPFMASVEMMAFVFTVEEGKVIGFDLYNDAYKKGETEENPTLAVVHARYKRVVGV